MKLKFLRSDRKTPYEIKVPLRVAASVVSDVIENTDSYTSSKDKQEINAVSSEGLNKITGSVVAGKRMLSTSNLSGNKTGTVFLSSSTKAWSIAVYFLIALLTIVLVALILRRF